MIDNFFNWEGVTLTVINGGAGAGKTTELLRYLEKELQTVPATKIAYTSFTRKGTYQGVDLAKERFDIEEEQCRWFKTLHSLCLRVERASGKNVMTEKDFNAIYKSLGWGMAKGTRYLSLLSKVRAGLLTADAVSDNELETGTTYSLRELEAQLAVYKKVTGKVEFDDLLKKGLTETLDVEVAFIDEAQDLTLLQWLVCQALFKGAKRIYVAGDINQSLLIFAGAEPSILWTLWNRKTTIRIEKQKSFRCPSVVCDVAANVLCSNSGVVSVAPVTSDKPDGWVATCDTRYKNICWLASNIMFIWRLCVKQNKTMYVLAHTTRRAQLLDDLLTLCTVPHMQDFATDKMTVAWSSTGLKMARVVRAVLKGKQNIPVPQPLVKALKDWNIGDVVRTHDGTGYTLKTGCFSNREYALSIDALDETVVRSIRTKVLSKYEYWIGEQGWDEITSAALFDSVISSYCNIEPQRVLVSTVPRVKGGEADYVIYDATCGVNIKDDWGYHGYVALTRAKCGVYVFRAHAGGPTRVDHGAIMNRISPIGEYPFGDGYDETIEELYNERRYLWDKFESSLYYARESAFTAQQHRKRKAARAHIRTARENACYY